MVAAVEATNDVHRVRPILVDVAPAGRAERSTGETRTSAPTAAKES
jgi:hypothetical protein